MKSLKNNYRDYSYKDHKGKSFAKPQVKTEYDALQPEYDIIRAMIDARLSQNITQKELAARTGITQADISRIENGTRNPSLTGKQMEGENLGKRAKSWYMMWKENILHESGISKMRKDWKKMFGRMQKEDVKKTVYLYGFYDVNEKRVQKVFKICKKYLSHFQKSVFRGEMTPSKFIQLRKDLNQVIDKDEDFICIIKLMNDNVFGEEVLGNGGEVTGESLMI